jgi:hypothetical protein
MLLQPADFYSYSRATGTKPPENDQERAAMAVDVIDFKRNQLRAPSPEDNEGRDLSLIALGAGIVGSIIGGRKIMKGFGGTTATPTRQDPFKEVLTDTPEINKLVSTTPEQPVQQVKEDKVVQNRRRQRRSAKTKAQADNQTLLKDLNTVEPSKIVESPTNVENVPVEIKGDIGKITQTGRPSALSAEDVAAMNRRPLITSQTKRSRTSLTDIPKGSVLQFLKNAGMGELEIDARMDAYANTRKKQFLNPAFNVRNIGSFKDPRTGKIISAEEQFIKSFDEAGVPLINAKFDNTGKLESYIPIELPVGVEKGELTRGIGGTTTPVEPVEQRLINQDIQLAEQGIGVKYIPQAPKTIIEGEDFETLKRNVLKASQVEGEQFALKRQEWTNRWDQLYRQGGTSGVTKPREELRVVTKADLNITALGDQTYGEVLLNKNPEALKDILEGKPRELQVPFQVNKQKAINALEEAQLNKSPNINALESEVLEYVDTGRALSREYQKIVAPVADSARVTKLPDDTRFYSIIENPDGVPNLTPKSQAKGKLVGGTTEPVLQETLSALKYVPTAQGMQPANLNNVRYNPLNPQVDVLKTAQGQPVKVSAADQRDFVMMQSMSLNKVELVIDPKTNQPQQAIRRKRDGDVFEAGPLVKITTTKVNAPLQIKDAKTGADLTNKLRLDRNIVLDAAERAQGEIVRQQRKVAADKLKRGEKIRKDFNVERADYKLTAKKLNTILEKERGITLPVLQSKSDSFDFMESLLGGPTSRPETFTYGNIGEDANTKIKQVFPASPNDRDFLTLNRLPLPRKFESKTTPTSDLSRMTSPDVSTFDKKEQYKTDRLEMDNTFDERFLDTGARELGSARRSNRPSDVEMTQRQGRTKFELEQKQLDLERGRKITGKDKVPDFTENLPDNVETLIQGSIAQGKRRAGAAKKKRGRR